MFPSTPDQNVIDILYHRENLVSYHEIVHGNKSNYSCIEWRVAAMAVMTEPRGRVKSAGVITLRMEQQA
jgi:hypothetical protein